MRVAFYKGRYGNIVDWLICLRTWGKHSHVELVFSDGMSFSSSQWDGGVRFKEIGYSHPERWDFIELDYTEAEEKALREHCESFVGCFYDFVGIFLDQLLPLNIQIDEWWWCSEIVGFVLDIHPYRVDPSKLYRFLRG